MIQAIKKNVLELNWRSGLKEVMKMIKLLCRVVYEVIAKHLPASTSFVGGGYFAALEQCLLEVAFLHAEGM